ncbi:MAG TPA: Sapep family Mn(2+)-dependent dipeptidase [Candidatus Ventricola gallistercoris]|nr:Sapep family Mn(2+)-dependent dipeptidase [Candidatus Ventricola gallistercoris]
MEINPKLDAALKALEGDMTETLARWVRVPSVRAERSAGNAPFGAQVRRALEVAMEDMARLGMNPRDVDGYCCDAEIGTGDEVIAVLAHLDVVPEGEGWHHDPYGAEIVNGRMVGRGTSDDKGPGVAALFAMKAIVDAGIPLRRRCRLILGCDEECGMQDLEYYEQKIGLPAKGFSPDAEFPLINTEKGIMQMKLDAPMDDARLLKIACGTRCNVVPGTATALLAGDWREAAAEAFQVEDEDCQIETALEDGNTRLTVTGVPAHASTPEKGKNAAKMLLAVLHRLEIGGAPVALLDEAAGEGDEGVGLGIAGSDAVSGRLTINLGLLSAGEGKISVTFDCRYPVFFSDETIGATVQKRLAPAGFVMEPQHASHPHHVPESSELVKKLMDVYNGITGEQARPFAIGGGTYARHLQEGVAFGMLFQGEPELAHQADESIDLANFAKAARIYAYAIVALCA